VKVKQGIVADRLHRFAREISSCRKCLLHKGRRHAVPGEGSSGARVVIVGEAPGALEDRTGRPFVGPAGKFLDRLLDQHGIRRQELFLTSCVKCRPPGNRNPKRDELTCCVTNWLRPQLDLIGPEIVVLAGLVAAQQFLEEPVVLAELHGTEHRRRDRIYFITYHPAAAMRFPVAAKAMQADFEKLSGKLREQELR
jgi:uracil-DNA glycosylase family 4